MVMNATEATVSSLKELNPGDLIWIANLQFAVTNPAVFVSHDQTGLQRPIGYARFDRGALEPEFAIWQHEMILGCSIITRRGPDEPKAVRHHNPRKPEPHAQGIRQSTG